MQATYCNDLFLLQKYTHITYKKLIFHSVSNNNLKKKKKKETEPFSGSNADECTEQSQNCALVSKLLLEPGV